MTKKLNNVIDKTGEIFELTRVSDDGNTTLGKLRIRLKDSSECINLYTVEPSWKNNQKNISCIPAGKYKVNRCVSRKHGECFRVMDVPERSLILIHSGNASKDTKGCICVGERLDKKHKRVLDSKKALKTMLKLIKEPLTLEIINKL